jgi:GT2 family glycosyltransferase
MTHPKVTVILVNWNNHEDTLECLRSLQGSSYQPREVILVENGSRPESVAALRGAPGYDLLIESPRNLGFTGGNNLGIRAALERGADLVFVLNNDTIVNRETIGTLVAALAANPDAGIATPKIRFYRPDNLIWYGGGTFSTWVQNPIMSGYKQIDDGRWDTPGDVDFASGCAMLVRRALFDRFGGFVEEYFAVWEDLDFCLNARSAGYRIMYVPSAVIWHKESSAAGGHDAPGYVYYQIRNRLLFLARWVRSPAIRASAYLFLAAHLTKRSLVLALRGKWAAVAAVAAAVEDGLAGRGGARGATSRLAAADLRPL